MSRASVPLLGAVLLVGVTVLLVVVLTVVVTGFSPPTAAEPVVIEATADSVTGRVTVKHVTGPPLDDRRVTVRVEIDGEPLAHQPPVPFYAADGFRGFPSGPFNPSADPAWTAGETASFHIAFSNDPSLSSGAELTVIITREGRIVARATAIAS